MQKNSLTRFVALISVLILASILALSTLVIYETRSYAKKEKETLISVSLKDLAHTINSFMSISGNDFSHLYTENTEELQNAIDNAANNSGSFIFITDSSGKVLMESNSADIKAEEFMKISPDYLSEAVKQASASEIFYSDFGGVFEKDMVNKGILMQKKFVYSSMQTKFQTVGMLFISAPADYAGAWAVLIPIVSVLIIIAMLLFAMLFIIIERKMMIPLRKIGAASKSFAHGDFSARIDAEEADGDLAIVAADFNEMAEKIASSEKSTNSFIASLSHDLRTPMTTINGYVQNMKEGIIPPEKYPHYLDIIHAETKRLSERVSQMLESSRLQAGEKKYNFEKFDICECARLTLISFEDRICKKDIDISFIAESDRIFVFADKTAIQQVIYNLTDNALKFTPEKGKLTIEIKSSPEKAFFAIENTGDGIPPEELPRLFDRFYKSDRSRGIDKSGSGLGLYIAKSIIQAHKEDIWVTSEYKKYCKFVFSLPLSI